MRHRRTRADWDSDEPLLLRDLEVEINDDPQPSGLLDKDGHPLVRYRQPAGFLTFDTEDYCVSHLTAKLTASSKN